MSLEEKIDSIIGMLQEAKSDASKCDNGKVGSPGTRLRKAAQEAKRNLDEVRRGVIAARKP